MNIALDPVWLLPHNARFSTLDAQYNHEKVNIYTYQYSSPIPRDSGDRGEVGIGTFLKLLG